MSSSSFAESFELIFIPYLMVVGAAVGSFVGVVVARLPHAQSVVRPRSRCDTCQTTIAWYDNVPLLSFVWLRGRCRTCGTPIGMRAFWLEAVMGLLFGAVAARFGVSYELVLWLPLVAGLLAITCIDIDYFWVPDALIVPLTGLALAASLLPGRLGFVAALWGVLPALGLWLLSFLYLRLTHKEGMGLGDVKLLGLLGMAMGAKAAVAVLILASLQGAVIGLFIIWRGGHTQAAGHPMPAAFEGDDWQPDPHAVPFGPFLMLATLELLLAPDWVEAAHLRLMGSIVQWVDRCF